MNRRSFIQSIFSTLALLPSTAVVTRSIPVAKENITLLITALAGFQYYAGERFWTEIGSGDTLEFMREPTNLHDPQAVALFWKGYKIGYIPRRDNTVIAQLMDRKTLLESRIIEKNKSMYPWRRILFTIKLPG